MTKHQVFNTEYFEKSYFKIFTWLALDNHIL